MKYWKPYKLRWIVLFISLISACKKNPSGPKMFVISYYTLNLTPASLLPGDTSTQSFAAGTFSIMQDGKLYYDFYFTKVLAGETPGKIVIYRGDPVTNGSLLYSIDSSSFDNTRKSVGSVTPPQAVIDSFVARAPMYVVITSASHPNGLVRGTLAPAGGATSYFGKDIRLSKDSIKPAINVASTGSVYLRLLSDNTTLYSKVIVNNLPTGDSLISAAIRNRSDNSVAVYLTSSSADFGVTKSQSVTLSATPIINSGQYYIDVRTKLYPNGLIKGFY